MRLVLAPVLAASVLGVIAALSVAMHQALLAPSLASAAFSQMLHPEEASAKPSSIAAGQLIGAGAGFFAVFVAGQVHEPAFIGVQGLSGWRVVAIVLAAVLTASVQLLTGAKTPAGGATALTVALGLETANLVGAARLLGGIVLVTALGECARRLIILVDRHRTG